jgi:uncharacterized membrane protein (GlpM family)
MMPTLSLSGLGRAKPWAYAVRFVFGGVVTVCAGLAAKAWGPLIGGLFLAFPAILPASLTLVNQHDGRSEAIDDARGGRLGSTGLAVFALLVWRRAREWPETLVLAAALAVWLLVDSILWWWRNGRDRR